MSGDTPDLKLSSDEELEAGLNPGPSRSAPPADEPYQGPERRTGSDRRVGPADRREAIQFKPDEGPADRRTGKDRRKKQR